MLEFAIKFNYILSKFNKIVNIFFNKIKFNYNLNLAIA